MLAGLGCICCIWCKWWLQQHGGQQQCGQLFGVLWLVCLVAAVLASVVGRGMEVAEWSFCDLVCVGQPCLASHDPSIVEWTVLATTSMVLDACWLYACVRGEMRMYMCGSGSGVDDVAIAVDREATRASPRAICSEKLVTFACAPYE